MLEKYRADVEYIDPNRAGPHCVFVGRLFWFRFLTAWLHDLSLVWISWNPLYDAHLLTQKGWQGIQPRFGQVISGIHQFPRGWKRGNRHGHGFLRPAAGHSPQGQVEPGQTHPRSPAHGGGWVTPWTLSRNLSKIHGKILPQSHSAPYFQSQNSVVKLWDGHGQQNIYIGKSIPIMEWPVPHGGRRGESSPPLCGGDEARAVEDGMDRNHQQCPLRWLAG
jgi:hypothetical protein